jgi:hypothetical protein
MSAGLHTAHSNSITIAEAGKLWLDGSTTLERATLAAYRQHLDPHVTPLIGQVKLSQPSVPAVRAFEGRLKADRSPIMVRKELRSLRTPNSTNKCAIWTA